MSTPSFEARLRTSRTVTGRRRGWRERFGLICAAGELGVQFGILPWEQSDPLNDATELLKVWLDERGGADALRGSPGDRPGSSFHRGARR